MSLSLSLAVLFAEKNRSLYAAYIVLRFNFYRIPQKQNLRADT